MSVLVCSDIKSPRYEISGTFFKSVVKIRNLAIQVYEHKPQHHTCTQQISFVRPNVFMKFIQELLVEVKLKLKLLQSEFKIMNFSNTDLRF